ncbi:MAG: hypothetical protein RIR00_2094, partial [Pseudomonadota bacterium]
MKTWKWLLALLLTLQLGLTLRPALALEIQAYTPEALASATRDGRAVVLHFHADWCPICRAQDKVLQGWQGDASLPLTVFHVDYDRETGLRRQLRVRSQSTLLLYRAGAERDRV